MRRLLSLVLAVAMVVLSMVVCDAGKKAGIEGKVVDGKGQPMKGIKMIANQVTPLKGYEHFETTTGADGTFKFKGLFPSSEYTIEPWFESGKAVGKVKIQSGPEGQTNMLDRPFEIRFIPSKTGIVTDSKTGLQWAPSNGQSMNHFQAEGYVHSLSLDGGGWRLPTITELQQVPPMKALLKVADNWIWSGDFCSLGARHFNLDYSIAYCDPRNDSRIPYRVLAVRSPK